jgi:hypothetical protein
MNEYNAQDEAERIAKRVNLELPFNIALIEYRKPYTVAIINSEIGVCIGVAKQSPRDKFNEQIGGSIAIARAIRELGARQARRITHATT